MTDHDKNGKKYHDGHGKFANGNPGRPVGSKNRNAIRDFVQSKVDQLPGWFDALETDCDRLEYLLRLLPYAFPRLQAVAQVDSEGRDIRPPQIDLNKLSDSALHELLNSINDESNSGN